MKKLSFCLVIITVLLFGAQVLAETGSMPYPTYDSQKFAAIDDLPQLLKSAGFTNPQKFDVPQKTTYYPNYYYTVDETINAADANSWGKAANMVTVFLRETPFGWEYKNNEMQTEYISGRYQAKASFMSLYLVVTGPDKDKIEKLLQSFITIPWDPNQ